MQEDRFDEEHVAQSVADGLIDDLRHCSEVRESGGWSRVRGDGREGGGGEENCAVPVGFEVDADRVGFGGVVQVFDARRDAGNGHIL